MFRGFRDTTATLWAVFCLEHVVEGSKPAAFHVGVREGKGAGRELPGAGAWVRSTPGWGSPGSVFEVSLGPVPSSVRC